MRMEKIELRSLDIRAADDGSGDNLHIEGYAAVFNQRTLLWESSWSGTKYFEVIEPGAIDSQTDMSDIVLKYNHRDSALLLARSSNGTLTVTPDEYGLKVEARIAPTTAGKDIYTLIKRGDISKMSFAFTVDKDAWDSDKVAKEETRTIKHISAIIDVSPVDFPAYDGTSITARGSSDIIEQLKQKEKDDELRKRLIVATYL